MGFGEEDGEEFDQVKVALVPVVDLDVPDEFGVSGHVVVSDHAAVPPAAELHPDVSSDEVVRVRGRGMRRRGGVGGGEYLRPFAPHGLEGISVVGNGGAGRVSPPVGRFVGRIYERTSQRSPLVPRPTYKWGWYQGRRGWCWVSVEGPSSSRDGCGAGLWDGVGRRARADRREGSGGCTRCSWRYGRRDRGVRVRSRVRVR